MREPIAIAARPRSQPGHCDSLQPSGCCWTQGDHAARPEPRSVAANAPPCRPLCPRQRPSLGRDRSFTPETKPVPPVSSSDSATCQLGLQSLGHDPNPQPNRRRRRRFARSSRSRHHARPPPQTKTRWLRPRPTPPRKARRRSPRRRHSKLCRSVRGVEPGRGASSGHGSSGSLGELPGHKARPQWRAKWASAANAARPFASCRWKPPAHSRPAGA